jgi:hypothetical protein
MVLYSPTVWKLKPSKMAGKNGNSNNQYDDSMKCASGSRPIDDLDILLEPDTSAPTRLKKYQDAERACLADVEAAHEATVQWSG